MAPNVETAQAERTETPEFYPRMVTVENLDDPKQQIDLIAAAEAILSNTP